MASSLTIPGRSGTFVVWQCWEHAGDSVCDLLHAGAAASGSTRISLASRILSSKKCSMRFSLRNRRAKQREKGSRTNNKMKCTLKRNNVGSRRSSASSVICRLTVCRSPPPPTSDVEKDYSFVRRKWYYFGDVDNGSPVLATPNLLAAKDNRLVTQIELLRDKVLVTSRHPMPLF